MARFMVERIFPNGLEIPPTAQGARDASRMKSSTPG